jgi:hypothetical protein
MGIALISGIVWAGLVMASGEEEKKPDKTIEIREGAAGYVESGKTGPGEIAVVVGQTVRWQNQADRAQSATSDLKVEGKPLFDTKLIKPGESKDLLFDINVYEKAGGKRAGAVTLAFHSTADLNKKGKIVLLSAAKR